MYSVNVIGCWVKEAVTGNWTIFGIPSLNFKIIENHQSQKKKHRKPYKVGKVGSHVPMFFRKGSSEGLYKVIMSK
jgi:hypothetical protein